MAKKTKQVAIRLSDDLLEALGRQVRERKADDLPDYIRGLILLDLANDSANLVLGHDIPSWVTLDYRFRKAINRHTQSKRR